MTRLLIFVGLLLSPVAGAQVVNVEGGSSTEFSSSGGQILAYFPNSAFQFGAGLNNGQPRFGAAGLFHFKGGDLTLGDRTESLAAGEAGTILPLRGVTFCRQSKNARWTLFAGATGESFSAPFFVAASTNHFGSGFSYERQLRDFRLYSVNFVSRSQRTLAEGVGWVDHHLAATMDGGLLNSAKIVDAKFSGHVRIVSFGAGRSTYLLGQTNATVTSGNLGLRLGTVDFSANEFASSHGSGQIVSAGTNFSFLNIRAAYISSRYATTWSGSVGERIGRRFTLSQFVNESSGHFSLDWGGQFRSNLLTFGVDYQNYFMPLYVRRNPFQQALSITVSLQLPHSSRANLQTYLAPNGRLRYNVDGGTYLQGPYDTGFTPQGTVQNAGKYLIEGTVVDDRGDPIQGAAVKLGKQILYSGSNGQFSLRTKHSQGLPLVVLVDQFLVGTWKVVSAPATVSPDVEAQIVVRRRSHDQIPSMSKVQEK